MCRAVVVALLFLALVLATRAVVASNAPLQRAVLELRVNGVERGEVFVVLRGSDILVPLDDLHEARLAKLEAPTEMLFDARHVSLSSCSDSLQFEYDEQALSLDLIAKPALLESTVIDLSPTSRVDAHYDYDPSWFLNYAPRLIDGHALQTYGETGLALGAAVIQSSATYDVSRGATRLQSSISLDDTDNLRTATLGDTFISTGPLSGGIMLGGLSLSRNFALDPYLVKIPRLGYTGETMAPATVDVYVNDVLVRRVPVAPGRFELTNVTPVAGAGTTRYVLRDAFGQQQRLESTYYASSAVLAPGLSEYDYGVGFARDSFGTRSWSYGEPTFVARHRVGLSRHLTWGYRAEFDRTRANAGGGVTLAGDFGELEFEHASSTTTDRLPARGSAALLAYGYRWPRGAVRTVSRGTSPEYSTLTLDPLDDRALAEQVVSTGLMISSSTSVAANLALAWMRDSGPGAQAGLTFSARLTHALNLQLRGTRGRTWFSDWHNDAFATLTWSLPEGHSAQLIGHAGTEQSGATARVARSLRRHTDVGYELSGALGDTRRMAGVVRGRAPFGQAAATYTNTDGEQHSILEASGGIVAVAGDVHFTVPARQSFAVLEVPGARGVRGYVDNREVGETNANGRLFVPGLRAYEANRLRINHADLPLEYGLEQEEVVLSPPRRGGAVVRFESRSMHIVRGRLVHVDGDAPVESGTLRVVVGEDVYVSPLGTNGEFEFDGLPQGSWRGLARSARGVCFATLTVTDADAFMQHLGTLNCSPHTDKEGSTP